MKTWVVRIYDRQDNIVDEYLIENRTEHEAVKEAESDSVVLQNDSWTLTASDGTPISEAGDEELDRLLELRRIKEIRQWEAKNSRHSYMIEEN